MARETLEKFVTTGKRPLFLRPEDPGLLEPASCFVTLRKRGKLRGCVGSFKGTEPLFEEVAKMTELAASQDFRFRAVQVGELDEIRIEISVIQPLEKISSADEIEVGRHGIYVKWKDQSGAFLPEVASEMHWTAQEFVKACLTEKAGIPERAWPKVELYRFTTEKIAEKT